MHPITKYYREMSRDRLIEKEEQKRLLEEMMQADEKDGLYEVPTHYQTNSGYDVIDFCNAYGLNFNKGCAVKYLARAGKKEDVIKDLKKAIDFIQREIKFITSTPDN